MEPIINPELVGKINSLVEAWNTADRRIREMLHGWEQRATRAGLERGFYRELATLPGIDAITGSAEIDDQEETGRLVYDAYRRGGMAAALDALR